MTKKLLIVVAAIGILGLAVALNHNQDNEVRALPTIGQQLNANCVANSALCAINR